MTTKFSLPSPIEELIVARNKLRNIYVSTGLKFTLDGNLVGDFGEAVAAEIFGIALVSGNTEGIDGYASDGRSVQVKSTGTNRGPAFRCTKSRADHLLFLTFDYERLSGEVTFNGPEEVALQHLPREWNGQRSLSRKQIVDADQKVHPSLRLKLISQR